MRKSLFLTLIMLVVLAACGGDDDGNDDVDVVLPTRVTGPTVDPTAIEAPVSPLPPDSIGPGDADDQADTDGTDLTFEDLEAQIEPPVQQAGVLPTQTPASEGALPVVPPGTLVVSETEDPDPQAPLEYVYFTQEGGLAGTVFEMELFPDGRVVVNGIEGTVDQATIAQLDQSLREINFFGLQPTFLGPPGTADTYRYRLLIRRGEQEKMINAQDGFTPTAVLELLAQVRSIGEAVLQVESGA
ncbi:MAG: hypothetical protein ACOCX5_04055 [Chloroflexota bacterium]